MNSIITIDVINAIITKAINKKLYISGFNSNFRSEIIINNENDKRLSFYVDTNDEDEKEFSLYTDNGSIQNIKIESESFVLKFKLLVEDCINYSKQMALKDIENFLTNDPKDKVAEVKDINDLDNEDD